MSDSVWETTVIGQSEKLPFLLELQIATKEKYPIRVLSSSKNNISECIYPFTELKPIKLTFFSSKQELEVKVIWNKVYDDLDTSDERSQYLFTTKKNAIVIYKHLVTEEYYPFRCGLYHFTVQYQGNTYYGAFRINPKNIGLDQFQAILETLNIMIDNMGYDNEQYVTNRMPTEDVGSMALIPWLVDNERKIIQAYEQISKEKTFIRSYQLERKPGKKDATSLRKEELLALKRTTEKNNINKRFIRVEKLPYYGYIKSKTILFIQILNNLISTIEDDFSKWEKKIIQLQNECMYGEELIKTLKQKSSITEREKTKYVQLNSVRKEEIINSEKKIAHLNERLSKITALRGILRKHLLYGFLKDVKEVSSINVTDDHSLSYRFLLHIFHLLDPYHNNKHSLFPLQLSYKPTYLLYEYYCYLSLITLFYEMGFSDYERPMREQIEENLIANDLKDGGVIKLTWNDYVIILAYNDLIEINSYVALRKGSHFFAGDETKKPDIRMDLYTIKNGIRRYYSSLICEIKYSPMFNVYQPVGNTKAMEQLYKYWTIKYVTKENEKNIYHRNPVYEVICLYPGSSLHSKKMEQGCGIFLQYYPIVNSDKQIEFVGKRELMKQIRDWLDSVNRSKGYIERE